MLNIAAGLATVVIVSFVLWISPKIIEWLALPDVLKDIVKLIIGAIPWIFTSSKAILNEFFASISSKYTTYKPGSERAKWALYTSGKLFILIQLISFLVGASTATLESKYNGSPNETLKILNATIVFPISVAIAVRYGMDLYDRQIKVVLPLAVFMGSFFTINAIDTVWVAFSGAAAALFQLEAWQVYARFFVNPVVLTIGLLLGWLWAATLGFLKRPARAQAPAQAESAKPDQPVERSTPADDPSKSASPSPNPSR